MLPRFILSTPFTNTLSPSLFTFNNHNPFLLPSYSFFFLSISLLSFRNIKSLSHHCKWLPFSLSTFPFSWPTQLPFSLSLSLRIPITSLPTSFLPSPPRPNFLRHQRRLQTFLHSFPLRETLPFPPPPCLPYPPVPALRTPILWTLRRRRRCLFRPLSPCHSLQLLLLTPVGGVVRSL